MNVAIIGMILLLALGILAIPCSILDKYHKVQCERRCNRIMWLAKHPNYREDENGNLYKIK